MNMKSAYPRPDFQRSEWLNLNGSWDFSLNNENLDMKIQVPYPWGSPLSGIVTEPHTAEAMGIPGPRWVVDDLNGTGLYRKMVSWNPQGQRIILRFGAVDYTCTVWVNGKEMGSHQGGYAAFEFDVTDVWDRSAENEIKVSATDTGAKTQTYGKQGYGDARGIWQTVWLETRPASYIESFFVQTKMDGTVTFDLETCGAADGSVISAAFALEGSRYEAQAEVKDNKACLVLSVPDPRLWTPDTPFLYEGTLTLGEDCVSTYFGIREIGTGHFGEHQKCYITLNGKPIFLFGTLDQSYNPKGFFTLPSDDDCREEIMRMKRIGLNMARIHIKAEEPLKLYWADKLGLLIMEDFPNFWGEPLPEVKQQYEKEFEAQMKRDRNHPAVFYWVVFNETWGLFHFEKDEDGKEIQVYRKETADWVVSCYKKVKELDPTRLVEDNSVCHGDHTITDVNTWHFYYNGYEKVKEVVEKFVKGCYVGSEANFREGYTMADVPCMNSECGNVWGILGGTGDSDISWHYKYMMNEFRLHDTLCGFIFTEFHDVINEYNGYYRIDNDDKDFGYDEYGMTLRDLHAPDFVACDYPPMSTVEGGQDVVVPLVGSSFSDAHQGKELSILWTLTAIDPLDGDYIADQGEIPVSWKNYGSFSAGAISVRMPIFHDGLAILTWALYDGDEFIMQNCTLFDVQGDPSQTALILEPSDLQCEGWDKDFMVQSGNKRNGLGTGSYQVQIDTASIPGLSQADDLRICFEASTRPTFHRDLPDYDDKKEIDLGFMLGYRCDPEENPNTFYMTDNKKNPGFIEVLIDQEVAAVLYLEDSPADSRGSLSHHYQATDNLLDEAGTYGTLCNIKVPSALLLRLQHQKSFTLTLRTKEATGLSLYGRKSGRYAIGLVLRAE